MDIVTYLRDRGVRIRPQGGSHMAACPFHADRTPSFTIYPDDHYHCFSCQRHGSLVGLIAELEFPGMSGRDRWREAYRRARMIGAFIGEQPYPPPVAEPRRADPAQRAALTLAFRHYRGELYRSEQALGYCDHRGIADPHRIPIGFSPGHGPAFYDLVERLRRELGEGWYDVARSVGLLRASGGERLARRIMIVEEDTNQEVVYYQARAIDGGNAYRYLSPPGLAKPAVGLGLRTLEDRSFPVVALVEGPFDGLPLHTVGVPAVVLLGSVLRDALGLVTAAAGRTIAVALDRDAPGEAAADAAIAAIAAFKGRAIRFRPKEPYKDLGEWAMADGPEEIRAYLATRADEDRADGR